MMDYRSARELTAGLILAVLWVLATHATAGSRCSVHLIRPAGGPALRFDGYVFDDREASLRVVDESSLDKPRFGGIDPAMRSVGALAGVNGGFFSPDGAPLGQMIADGKTTGGIARGALTSGVVYRTAQGVTLARVAEYASRPRPGVSQLLQGGPFLVDAKLAVPGLEASKARTRTLVIHDGAHGWVIGVTGSISLDELARTLASTQTLGGVKIHRALNLDGGSSSACWIAGKSLRTPWKTVRNYLAVVPAK